jgi:hypothetical protein
MQREEERLKASGAEYYVAKGVAETTIRPEPLVDHVDSTR